MGAILGGKDMKKESDRPGAAILNNSKANEKQIKKQQRTEKMKIFTNTQKFQTFKHVTLTLLTLAAIAGIFYAGFTYGQKYENGINYHIQKQAQVLTAKAEAPASK